MPCVVLRAAFLAFVVGASSRRTPPRRARLRCGGAQRNRFGNGRVPLEPI